MYTYTELVKGIRDPHLILRELNRLYYTKLRTRSVNSDGIDVISKDWDNLIIFDACRFDLFSNHISNANIDGKLRSVESRASVTREFLLANFADRDLRDVVYITGNAWYLKMENELNSKFHKVYDVNSQHPSNLTEVALKASMHHPHKRLIIHYLPPHAPYIGETAKKNFPPYEDQHDILSRIRRCKEPISRETLIEAYNENLSIVLSEAAELLDKIEGKTVISADHGELLNDRIGPIPIQDYGHHEGLYVSELINVPWFVCDWDSRKSIKKGEEKETEIVGRDESVDKRLEHLGYL